MLYINFSISYMPFQIVAKMLHKHLNIVEILIPNSMLQIPKIFVFLQSCFLLIETAKFIR